MTVQNANPSLTICICTMDRADILKRCLESIGRGTRRPDAVLVSDDSRNAFATASICREFANVTYLEGPRRGLCANRNWVIRRAATTHVSLIDDDAVLSEDFVETAKKLILACEENIIFTGVVNEDNTRIIPQNTSFWGHFTRSPEGRFENINLNCNIFSRHAFDVARFDEAIGYGYEDVDLCLHLLSAGFLIQFEPRLRNTHIPPKAAARAVRAKFLQTQQARFYTSVKRYMLWKKNYFALISYVILAPAHRALFAVKSGFWFDLRNCVPDMVAAVKGGLRERGKLKRKKARAEPADLTH